MTYSVTIREKIKGTEITLTNFTTVTNAKLAAERYINKNGLDAGYTFGLAEASKCVRENLITIDVFKNNKNPVKYRWHPLHPRYEPHLVIRGGYFRKVAN